MVAKDDVRTVPAQRARKALVLVDVRILHALQSLGAGFFWASHGSIGVPERVVRLSSQPRVSVIASTRSS